MWSSYMLGHDSKVDYFGIAAAGFFLHARRPTTQCQSTESAIKWTLDQLKTLTNAVAYLEMWKGGPGCMLGLLPLMS